MAIPKAKRNPNGTYGPTTTGDFYFSKSDHRRSASFKKNKTRWCIEEGQEYHIFKIANEPKPFWFCKENNCLFGFFFTGESMLSLGQDGEILAKFPNINNITDPWHGYPVKTEEPQNRPCSELLDYLFQENKINYSFRIKIERGTI